MRLMPLLLTSIALGFAGAPTGEAHTRLKPTGLLKPRSELSSLKTAPCGNIAVDEAKRVQLTANQDLTVEWEETINHPGHFRIAFALDGATGFDAHVIKDDIADDQSGAVNINDPSTYHQFSTTVKVPGTNCDKCAIQMIQVMTDHTPPTFYYSCADVKIVGGADPQPAPIPPSASGSGAADPSGSAGSSGTASAAAAPAAPATSVVKPPVAVVPAAPTGLKVTITKGGAK